MGSEIPIDIEINKQVTETLEKVFTNINSWLSFAEAKNATLLALNGAGVYAFVSFLTNADYNGSQYFTIYAWMVVVFLVIGIVISLLSFSPVVHAFNGKKKAPHPDKENINLLFYGDLAKYECNKEYVMAIYKKYFNVDIEKNNVSKIHLDYADEILINSRITLKKYKFFRWALYSDLSALFTPILVGIVYLCYLGFTVLSKG